MLKITRKLILMLTQMLQLSFYTYTSLVGRFFIQNLKVLNLQQIKFKVILSQGLTEKITFYVRRC